MARDYHLIQTGQQVQDAINKIIALGPATATVAGIMTAEDKAKLDSIGIKYNTTEYWDNARGYIPKAGEIIIYLDYKKIETDSGDVYIPGIKIGSGGGYVQDLAFLGEDDSNALLSHISNMQIHIDSSERVFWNRKLNVDDSSEVVGESLIFNRN